VKATRRRDGSGAPAGPASGAAGGEAASVRRSFVVSVSEDATGQLGGVVEAVRTGRKERFRGLESLGPVIEAMFRRLRGEDPGVRSAMGPGTLKHEKESGP